MIDKRIGKRIKARREQLGLTQAQLAEKLGVAVNYVSTIERGASFPRCEKLIQLLNALECSADEIFQDVLQYNGEYRTSTLSRCLEGLPSEDQRRILGVLELMIAQAKETP